MVAAKTDARTERDRRIEENIGLVHACAARFRGRGAEYEDLFQAGCVGLCRAADGFDPSRGFAFSTYAVPLILGEIRHIFRDGGTVKVGRTVKTQAQNLRRLQQSLEEKLQREPTVSELSAASGYTAVEVAFILGSAQPVLSLSSGAAEEDRPPEIPVPPQDDAIEARICLQSAMDRLDARERLLVELRYFQSKTQSQTAAVLGISQVQVSRKERAILQKLRICLNSD